MTITESGRRTQEQILIEAREQIGDGPLPSKTALSKSLRTHYNTASKIYDTLSEERRAERAERSRERRRAMIQVTKRKASKRPVVVRPRPFVNPDQPLLDSPGGNTPVPVVEPAPVVVPEVVVQAPKPVVATPSDSAPEAERRVAVWPAWVVASPAFVAIWAGWVGIGKLTGFGKVNLLPGIGKGWVIDTAITLPIGVEAYAGYAFYVALHRFAPKRARKFGGWSAAVAVLLGMGGQTAYHLMNADHMKSAPWQITTVVSCLPVAVFGLAAALVHMVRAGEEEGEEAR
jgi:hypothetical protein